jgi:ribonucleoside-diphosphate reductase alpha chain
VTDALAPLTPRPAVLRGVTRRIETPLGPAVVTLNTTDAGEPFEVFVRVGKAGSDLAGIGEAIGRLCSLCLRVPAGMDGAERLRAVVGELAGIGGARGLGAGQPRSLPDAIARALAGEVTADGDGVTRYTCAPAGEASADGARVQDG